MTHPARTITLALAALSTLALAGCEQQLPTSGARWQDGRMIVKFKEGADPVAIAEVRASVGTKGFEKLPLIGADALLFDEGEDVHARISEIGVWSELVEYAEPDFLYETSSQPSDYDGALLWGLTRIQSPLAWDSTTGSAGVVVAVIDTGVDTPHPDLAQNIWRNTDEVANNGVDDDGNGYIDDVVGWDFVENDAVPNDDSAHGTHVAGTIGAVGGNGGLVGVSPNVRIMALKTLSPYGGSSSGSIYAIDYARRNGARVINASWGSYGYSTALKEAINRAGQAGILFVAAAGNQGYDADSSPMFPASYDLPNVISVGASGGNDKLLSFSNYGSVVDIAAPGAEIASTVPGGEYAYMDGTSMASPHVAGAAALLLAVSPNLSVPRLREHLLTTADPVAALNGRVSTGGRLNVNRAVAAAMPANDPEPEPEPVPSDELTWEAVAGGSDHPYLNDFDETWTANLPGATELRLRFSNVSTEAGYDYVILYDGAGNEVARYDGNKGAVETVSIPGDTVYIRLTSDYSITGYGFEVSEIGYR